MGAMKARITIEYEVEPEGLTQAQLQAREEQAWMTGAVAIPDLPSVAVKWELVDARQRPWKRQPRSGP
jgi:hypothetical protein